MFPAFLLVFALVAFRLVPVPAGWENFSPMAAVVLCGAVYLPKRWALLLPLSAVLISEVALNVFRYEVPAVNPNTYAILASLALVHILGRSLRNAPSLGSRSSSADPSSPPLPFVFGAAILASLLFYLITNSVSWILYPGYAKTLTGWIQCLTVGTPGFPPTWLFFRNSLIGDLFFTGIFVLFCVILPQARRHFPAPSAAAQPRHH